MRKKGTKELLGKHGLKPQKYMGQNFLINKGVLKGIIDVADLKPSDTVLEIGPGLGTLTKELAKKAKKMIAIEKDRGLTRILNNELRIMHLRELFSFHTLSLLDQYICLPAQGNA